MEDSDGRVTAWKKRGDVDVQVVIKGHRSVETGRTQPISTDVPVKSPSELADLQADEAEAGFDLEIGEAVETPAVPESRAEGKFVDDDETITDEDDVFTVVSDRLASDDLELIGLIDSDREGRFDPEDFDPEADLQIFDPEVFDQPRA